MYHYVINISVSMRGGFYLSKKRGGALGKKGGAIAKKGVCVRTLRNLPSNGPACNHIIDGINC